MRPRELKTAIDVLLELSSTYKETTKILSKAAEEARSAKRLWGKPKPEQERPKLVKLGLDIMTFPGTISSIFFSSIFHTDIIGISLVAAGLIQEKRSPMYAVNVLENFQETVPSVQNEGLIFQNLDFEFIKDNWRREKKRMEIPK